MHIVVERSFICQALQKIMTLVRGRVSSPILGHVLLRVHNENLLIIGSDIDIEIIVNIPIYTIYQSGIIAAPARKFFDICRALSEQSKITLQVEEGKLLLYSKNSHFSLLTLPGSDFPLIEKWESKVEFCILPNVLKDLMELVQFSMGNQDVRYYLNGMLFEMNGHKLRTVATDGHRLSSCTMSVIPEGNKNLFFDSVIVPRKAVISMIRMLNIEEKYIQLKIGEKNISIIINNYILTSRLISGSFPSYKSIFCKKSTAFLETDLEKLRKALKRASILCNVKFRVVKFILTINQLKIISSNAEHEISEEILQVVYLGGDMEIAFNVYYILDVLNVLKSTKIRFLLVDEHSAVKIVGYPENETIYVVMPIRL